MKQRLLPTAVAAILLLAAAGSASRAANPSATDPAVCLPETASSEAAAVDGQGQHGADGDCDMQDGADQPNVNDQSEATDASASDSAAPASAAPAAQPGAGGNGQQGGNDQQGDTGGNTTQQDGEFEGDY
ncbi:MAG TPA: hypothetical protein VGS17_06310 [Candidatus Limnocylindria bacterium]|nr:hypothetical protein [Candidatus Limnocylindria bacterium]